MNNDPLNQAGGQTLGNTFKSIVFGPIFGLLFLAAGAGIVFFNERVQVNTARRLQLIKTSVLETSLDKLGDLPDGSLVCVSGMLKSEDGTKDTAFNLFSKDLIISRSVQVYNWREKITETTSTDSKGNKTTNKTYNYEKVWTDLPINSSNFQDQKDHVNPKEMPYKSEIFLAKDAKLGSFSLDQELLSHFKANKELPITADLYASLSDQIKKQYITDGTALNSWSSGNPEVGATRVFFSVFEAQVVTILGQKSKSHLSSWKSNYGEIFYALAGEKKSDQILESAESKRLLLKWIFRGLGFILLFLAILFVLSPITILTSFIPVLGALVEALASLGSLILAILLWVLFVSLAWVTLWPWHSALMVTTVIVFIFIWKRRPQN